MHPTTAATFSKLGMHGVSDNTTIGELTSKAHGLKGGSRRSRHGSKRRSRRSKRSKHRSKRKCRTRWLW